MKRKLALPGGGGGAGAFTEGADELLGLPKEAEVELASSDETI